MDTGAAGQNILPLETIPGPKNQSDLCTKNVPAALIDLYLEQLGVRYVDGRADVAQQLHAIKDVVSPVIAHPSAGKVGGGMISDKHSDSRVCASSPVGALLVEVIGGSVKASLMDAGGENEN